MMPATTELIITAILTRLHKNYLRYKYFSNRTASTTKTWGDPQTEQKISHQTTVFRISTPSGIPNLLWSVWESFSSTDWSISLWTVCDWSFGTSDDSDWLSCKLDWTVVGYADEGEAWWDLRSHGEDSWSPW